MNKRLDIAVQDKGIVNSRNKAQDLIKRGLVTVNKKTILKPSTPVLDTDEIVACNIPPFVGRGGEKIEAALTKWNIDVSDKTIADIGASTGGFTDCLLSRGVKKVYAIDVGTDQLDEKLRNDERVVVMEKTDVRRALLPELVDMAVVDVSFISITIIFKNISQLVKKDGEIIVLAKPQFEVGRDEAKKVKGVVRDEILQKKAVDTVVDSAEKNGLTFFDMIPSPILGGDGNKEFLLYFKKA
ncbi:MAG: TlyA family rRNA (cytidine-2'-O)-methyltransferase [Candidatus Taylorbacteria bacterium CG10_big_fil_rev_8_21_14_0_10_41_48]|uniref:TlyA family rRNA (Cytidine-2'-O)-methyltransferase n=1 Tax=Candidatus Taylorbacteria bacterium CG10_big_fil_rev_8_21_14_0_10_41_48 TaxID=1975024 RepID=A0A2M8LBW8_9BACT|nr:MAG: TlyA family rRNA (cytidine-2'-O)-methyltransferase [Candidatus Taylorbacteria bacterium CG10_big_fil_rev_8_21_14_0_10_41_48]